jgi:uncharacterized protein (TIGR02246 family)
MHRAFQDAFNAGDSDGLAGLYEEDAVLRLGGQIVAGRDAIRETIDGFFAMQPVMTIETRSVLESSEGVALLDGRWTLAGTGPDGSEVRMAGRNNEVIRRQPDGAWRFLIDNANAPE